MRFTFLTLCSLVAPALGKYNAQYWHVNETETSDNGFPKISTSINVLDGRVSGYYYATQWWFSPVVDGQAAYMGWQPREGEKQHLTYSVFGKGAWSNDPNCRAGADGTQEEDPGVSCAMEFPWKFNQNYTLVNEVTSEDDDYYTWTGHLIDDVTGEKTRVASYNTPKSWGLIDRTIASFDEWYKDPNGICVPHSKYIQYAPKVYKDGKEYETYQSAVIQQTLLDDCAKERGVPNQKVTGLNEHAILIENGIFGPLSGSSVSTSTA